MIPPKKNNDEYKLGIISDTHGLLRPDALKAFKDVDMIIHAGDFDTQDIYEALLRIAPVAAVRGNMDFGDLKQKLPATEVVEIGEVSLYVLHDLGRLDLDPVSAGFSAVIYGHYHRQALDEKSGVLYLNPGSAGPRRSMRPATVAILHIKGKILDASFVKLKDE